MTDNATIGSTHTVIMVECDQDVLGNEEIIVNVKRFLRDGTSCGCSPGVKGGPCLQQFSEEVVLSNIKNCLEMTHAELDLMIITNIQAVTKIKVVGKKGRKDCDTAFFTKTFQSARKGF